MPSEEKDVERIIQFSTAEDIGNYSLEEERKEYWNIIDTTEDKLTSEIKVDEISRTTENASQITKGKLKKIPKILAFVFINTQLHSADVA